MRVCFCQRHLLFLLYLLTTRAEIFASKPNEKLFRLLGCSSIHVNSSLRKNCGRSNFKKAYPACKLTWFVLFRKERVQIFILIAYVNFDTFSAKNQISFKTFASFEQQFFSFSLLSSLIIFESVFFSLFFLFHFSSFYLFTNSLFFLALVPTYLLCLNII